MHFIYLPIMDILYRWNNIYVVFCDWLLSFSAIFSMFIWCVACSILDSAGNWIAGSLVILCLIFWGTANYLQKWLWYFLFHQWLRALIFFPQSKPWLLATAWLLILAILMNWSDIILWFFFFFFFLAFWLFRAAFISYGGSQDPRPEAELGL